jgi:hypothetical protein
MVWEAVLKGLGPTAISYTHTVPLDLSLACNPRPLRQGAEEEKSLRSRDHPVCLRSSRVGVDLPRPLALVRATTRPLVAECPGSTVSALPPDFLRQQARPCRISCIMTRGFNWPGAGSNSRKLS